jgi:sucrose-6-phosphate hydrolase SacC (GH32 family)
MALYLEGNTYALFSSTDLKKWQKLSQISIPDTSECPEFFEIPVDGNAKETRWVFYGGNGHYFIGHFDGTQFTAESAPLVLHHGDSWYASQTYSDIPREDGRRILIPWAQIATPGMPFNQMMGIPVELQLRTTPEGLRLFAYPVKEVESLRINEAFTRRDLALDPGENPLSGVKGELLDVTTELELGRANELTLNLRGVPVTYDVAQQSLSLGKHKAGLKPVDGKIRLRILMDRTSVEVFANDGLLYFSIGTIVAADNLNLELSAKGGQSTIRSLQVYQLKSAWQR